MKEDTMSTRSVIAKSTSDGWVGRYAHWDGYPTCRAAELWTTYQELGNAAAVREYALRENENENGSWSSFVPPSKADEDTNGWCTEDEDWWVSSNGSDCGTEWAYVIEDDALVIFERRFGSTGSDQGHGVGMFGYGASDTDEGGYWALVGTYPWTDPEPDWELVEAA